MQACRGVKGGGGEKKNSPPYPKNLFIKQKKEQHTRCFSTHARAHPPTPSLLGKIKNKKKVTQMNIQPGKPTLYDAYKKEQRGGIAAVHRAYCQNRRFTKESFEVARRHFASSGVSVTEVVNSCFTAACKNFSCNNCMRHLLWVYALARPSGGGAVSARLCAYDITSRRLAVEEMAKAKAEADPAGEGGAEYIVLDHPLDTGSVAAVLELYGSRSRPGEYENFFDFPEDYKEWLCRSIRQRWQVGNIVLEEVPAEGGRDTCASRASYYIRKAFARMGKSVA